MSKNANDLLLRIIVIFSLFCFAPGCTMNQTKEAKAGILNQNNTKSADSAENRLDWFHKAKFGLFIHWGLYCVPAGDWNGKTDYGEWIQYEAGIPGAEYEKLAAKFNPVSFNAKDWVSVAKEAGMKYIVITSKHHEGFCMFGTKLTNFNIVDATPYHKDPLKELSQECKKQGITLCFYYSVKDWHNTDYPVKYTYLSKTHPEGFHGFPNPNADYQKYFGYLEGQVKELLSNYGPLGIIWFDWCSPAMDMNVAQNRLMAQNLVDSIHKWQPECLINDRLNGIGADYGTPEQEIPGGNQSKTFETCMTMNDHWGYNKNDKNWKSVHDIIFNLCDITSKGGNYLLNVGPTPEGVFPEESKKILKEVGHWLSTNGEAIYNAKTGGPNVRWNDDIKMITAKPGLWYLHVFNWPKDRKVFLDPVSKQVKAVYLLADKSKTPLNFKLYNNNTSVMINLPEKAPDEIDSVIVLEFKD